MNKSCLLLILSLFCSYSNSVRVKSVHAILRDKVMCIETSKLTLHENHTVMIENVNVTLSIHYYQNETMHILLGKSDMCLSKAKIDTTKETDVYFFCGKYQDPLLGTNNNLDMYKHMKIYRVEGNIDVSITNETGFNFTVALDEFEVRENIAMSFHLHGYDPCRFVSKSMEVFGKRCIPLCELYATGEGMFQCSNKLKNYNKDTADMLEVSHSPFQLTANRIHQEKKGDIVCVEATTDIRATCYAEFTHQELQMYSPRTQSVKTFDTRPSCQTMFFTYGYPGTFCFLTNRISRKNLITYFPKTLKLYNLTMYCDDFSFFNKYREINLHAVDRLGYKMMMIYDICPHSVREKGKTNRVTAFKVKDGYLIEEPPENTTNHSMIALTFVCIFILLLVVSLLLFFVFHVRKSCT